MRLLDFNDGFTSTSAPTVGEVTATGLKVYDGNSSFIAANGAAQAGDAYLNSTDKFIHYYDGSAWQSVFSNTSVVGIASGGTGQTAKTAAFNALSPLTTLGDIAYHDGTDSNRLAGDTSNTRKFLREQASGGVAQAPAWDTIQAGDVPTLNQNTTGTASNVTGTVAIANGGTGQTTKGPAFDALSPMSASGDMIYGGASGTGTRLAKGSDGQILTLASGIPSWADNAGGAGGGGSSVETLQQKQDMEKANLKSGDLAYSVELSGFTKPYIDTIKGSLLQQYTASDATISVVWNPVVIKATNPDVTSNTGWAAGTYGANSNTLGTVGTPKVGAACVSWNKTNAGAKSGIKYDQSAQTLGVSSNTRLWFWIFLPTASDIKNVYYAGFSDTTSNYRYWTTTTDYSGAALTLNAWNLIFFDISTGGTAVGTGWTSVALSRYQEIGVETNTAGTTITALAINGVYFSLVNPQKLGLLGQELGLFNTSTKDNIILATSNTSYDGVLTLDATVANTYVAGTHSGTSGQVAARGFIKRSSTDCSNGYICFDSTDATAGTVTTTQTRRIGEIFSSSVTKDYNAYVDMIPVQRYVVESVSATQAVCTDYADEHLNMLNGDQLDVFHPYYIEGKIRYGLLRSPTLTANSTWGSSQLTLTFATPNSDIVAGDIICKRHLSSLNFHSGTAAAKEVYSALSLDAQPDGIKMVPGFSYPNRNSVVAHFPLGGPTAAYATTSIFGSYGPMVLTADGSPNYQKPALDGRVALTGVVSGGGLYSADTRWNSYNADTGSSMFQVSFWFRDTSGFTGTRRELVSTSSSAETTGVSIYLTAGANTLNAVAMGSGTTSMTTPTYTANVWHHVAAEFYEGNSFLWFDGVLIENDTGAFTAGGTNQLAVLRRTGNNTTVIGNNIDIFDLIIWSAGSSFASAQVAELYNRGNYINTAAQSLVRYSYTASAKTGQKVSIKAICDRSTTAVIPAIQKIGMIGS